MVCLNPGEYHKTLSMVGEVTHDKVFAQAVIEGIQPGTVYGDNAENPNAFLIINHNCGFALVCGSSENKEFNREIGRMLLTESQNRVRQIRLAVYPDFWNKELNHILGSRLTHASDIDPDETLSPMERLDRFKKIIQDRVVLFERVKFHFNRDKFQDKMDFLGNIPAGFQLKRIDKQLLQKITGTIVPRFSWEPLDSFLDKGFGYCLMKGDEIAVTSFSAFISSSMADIGIETHLDFRKQGLGVYPAAAMIFECLKKGLLPVWGTNRENLGSRGVAKNLGFEELYFHPFYYSVKKFS